jgi:hypothetical protein
MSEQSKIRVRCNSNTDSVTHVFVDGEQVGTIAGNQEELFEVPPGRHEIVVGEAAEPIWLDVVKGDLIPLEYKASFLRNSIIYQWVLFILLVPGLWMLLLVLQLWLFGGGEGAQEREVMYLKAATVLAPLLAIVCFRLKLMPRKKYYVRKV